MFDVGIDELIQVCTGLNLSLCVRWLVPAVKPTDRAERRAAERESGGGEESVEFHSRHIDV